jgi:tetratricopeptide (TPR) repeat protein
LWRFDALRRAARLHARAVADRDAGRVSFALPAATKALVLVERRWGESSPDAAVVWHTIGTIREELSVYHGADSAYRRAAAILDGHRSDETLTPVQITVASSTARLRRALGRLNDAEALYAQTIELAERYYGSDTVEVAELLNDLAVVYKYAARFDKAEALYRRALPIFEATRGCCHVDVATIWHNLGGIEHARARFGTGEIYTRYAVQIRQAALGPDHVAVAKDIAALAALVRSYDGIRV